jgi:hypothetical protein
MTLTEFLLARIAEDERSLPCINCGRAVEPDGPRELGEFGHVAATDPRSDFWDNVCPTPTPVPRALADCEAKRRLITAMQEAVDSADGPDTIELDGYLTKTCSRSSPSPMPATRTSARSGARELMLAT